MRQDNKPLFFPARCISIFDPSVPPIASGHAVWQWLRLCLPSGSLCCSRLYHVAAASVVLIDLQQCCSHSLVYIYIHIQDMGSWAFDVSVVTYAAQQPHILDVPSRSGSSSRSGEGPGTGC